MTVRVERKFWARVSKAAPDECWPWQGRVNAAGYGSFQFGRREPCTLAHRYSAALAGMEINGRVVMHRCDNPRCVNPQHLRAGTQAENLADMTAKGRRATGAKVSSPGERNPNAKLTAAQVADLRMRAAAGQSARSLAPIFGISASAAAHAVRGDTWQG